MREPATSPPAVAERVKPRLRGVLHEGAFYVATAAAVPLVATAVNEKARVAALVFAVCVAGCFGISALYHRPHWSQEKRRRLACLDHAAVYFLIAGTYTPFALLVFSADWGIPVLVILWSGALLAATLKLAVPHLPKWVAAGLGLLLGWTGAAAFSQLLRLPTGALALVLAGGLAYSLGAVVYARRRPDPFPAVFGYHELFHALTVAAAACQYVAIAFYVLPRA